MCMRSVSRFRRYSCSAWAFAACAACTTSRARFTSSSLACAGQHRGTAVSVRVCVERCSATTEQQTEHRRHRQRMATTTPTTTHRQLRGLTLHLRAQLLAPLCPVGDVSFELLVCVFTLHQHVLHVFHALGSSVNLVLQSRVVALQLSHTLLLRLRLGLKVRRRLGVRCNCFLFQGQLLLQSGHPCNKHGTLVRDLEGGGEYNSRWEVNKRTHTHPFTHTHSWTHLTQLSRNLVFVGQLVSQRLHGALRGVQRRLCGLERTGVVGRLLPNFDQLFFKPVPGGHGVAQRLAGGWVRRPRRVQLLLHSGQRLGQPVNLQQQ